MPGNFKNDDLRIIKTKKSLMAALPKLLTYSNFGRITVNDLCEEAQLSRAAFYTHYRDKYDLLKQWLIKIQLQLRSTYDLNSLDIAQNTVDFLNKNKKIVKNLLEDASEELLDIVCVFLVELIRIPILTGPDGKTASHSIILSNFCAGGILRLLQFLVNSRVSADQLINDYLIRLLEVCIKYENTEKIKA